MNKFVFLLALIVSTPAQGAESGRWTLALDHGSNHHEG